MPLVSHDILVIMSRTFKKVDYDQALDLTVRLGDCLPPDHLARFVVDSVAQLDLSALYAQYGPRGGEPIDIKLRKTLYVKPFGDQFESKRKFRRKERGSNDFNKA